MMPMLDLLDDRRQFAAQPLVEPDAEDLADAMCSQWKGHYRIDGPIFIYADRDTGRVTTILGYPTHKIAHAG
jgi:hypothetical protein